MTETRNLIHLFKDNGKWCAIYPMFSDLKDCVAVAFSPIDIQFSEELGRSRDYGKYIVLQKIKDENPDLPTHSFYSEYWD